MQKNTKTIAATVVALFVILGGALMWMRNSQEVGTETEQSATELAGAVTRPTPDISAVMWDSKGASLTTKGKFSEAADAFQKSLEIQESPTVKFAMGRALEHAGRKQEAIKVFRQLAQSNSGVMSKAALKKATELESNA